MGNRIGIKELTEKVAAYSYKERIERLIHIGVKGSAAQPMEIMELTLIQAIRESNGEIDEVKRQRENEIN